MGSSSGSCAGCGGEVTLVLARPVIGADGHVALWCGGCFSRRDAILAEAARVVAPPSPIVLNDAVAVGKRPPNARRPRKVTAIELPEPAPARKRSAAVLALAGVTVAAAAAVAVIGTASSDHSSSPPVQVAASMTPGTPAAAPVPAQAAPVALPAPVAPPTAAPEHGNEAATDEGIADPTSSVDTQTDAIDLAALEEERPSLLDWVHPVTGTDEVVPLRGTRKFGARREGLSRTLCGAGHCGVDLSGPRGRPVVAVAWGTVVRVEHSARGRDGRSGRYVRIEHPEGVFTSYMHLDAIQADLKVGDEVDAGTVLGTLGKTAIYHGEQHLHFGLEIEDHGALLYVDPTPFLARAQVAPIPDQPLNLLPADEREQW